MTELHTSPDGQWIVTRRGRELSLIVGIDTTPAGEPRPTPGAITLDDDDLDLAIVGPPNVAVAVTRGATPRVALYQPPELELTASLALETPMQLAAITGPRLALVSPDRKQVLVVRVAGRALSAQPIDPGSVVEFAVGLERNQLLLGLLRKLEVWDAISARPLLRLQLQLPPPPRTVGAAQGHLWVTRPGSDEVFIYRLSDGRPFRHHAGSPVEDVICHPHSPVLVLVTVRGLVRLHCFAHSLALIDSSWTRGVALAQLVAGDDISLLGVAGDSEPWRVPIGAAAAPALDRLPEPTPPPPPQQTAAEKLRAMRERWPEHASEVKTEPNAELVRERTEKTEPNAQLPVPPQHATTTELPIATSATMELPIATADLPNASTQLLPTLHVAHAVLVSWREPIATLGADLVAGGDVAPAIAGGLGELGELAERLELPDPARRALIALYAVYLVGEPAISIARLAKILGDWTEALGQGELGALAMLRRRGGRVALRIAVTDLLDGLAPRAIRVVGSRATIAPAGVGAHRVPRAGKPDSLIESELAGQLGRIAVIEGAPVSGLLEARLHGATAVALTAPPARPLPWPRDVGLVVVADGSPMPSWVAALPPLAALTIPFSPSLIPITANKRSRTGCPNPRSMGPR